MPIFSRYRWLLTVRPEIYRHDYVSRIIHQGLVRIYAFVTSLFFWAPGDTQRPWRISKRYAITLHNIFTDNVLQTVQSASAPKGWLYYSFTPVGGAGKAFHAASMREFDAMLKIYWNYKPLDWILWDYTKTKVCGYDDSGQTCKKKWKTVAVDYGKSLFMHKGK